jgi:hypothetical protein
VDSKGLGCWWLLTPEGFDEVALDCTVGVRLVRRSESRLHSSCSVPAPDIAAGPAAERLRQRAPPGTGLMGYLDTMRSLDYRFAEVLVGGSPFRTEAKTLSNLLLANPSVGLHTENFRQIVSTLL